MEFSFLNGQAFEKQKRLQEVFILKCPASLLFLGLVKLEAMGFNQNKGQPQVKCGLWMKLMGFCVCRYMGVQILRERLGADANVWYCPSDKFAVISYPQNLITCYKQDLSNVQSYLLFATTHLEFVLCHNACPPIILARNFLKRKCYLDVGL